MSFPTKPLLVTLAAAAVSVGSLSCYATQAPVSVTRTYYIAADEVEWDYAPSGQNLISGEPWDSIQRPFVEPGPQHVGRVARKSLYREYTDSTFATLKPRPPEWEHLGYLGPLVRAVVGDTIRIVFRNNTTFPSSVHPHGVFYDKDSEGAPYEDGTDTGMNVDDGVPPGGTHVYTWPVPERAGPTDDEGSTAFWMYHSHTDEVADVNAGLMGPMIIARVGAADADGVPTDVDREIIMTFAEINENASRHLEHNIRTYATEPDSLTVYHVFGVPTVGAETQFNFRETLNGMIYGNLPMPRMAVGERVRWYIMGTTNFEVHAPHWHGNVVVAGHMRTDVLSLLTMQMVVADMVPDNPGEWLFHCHVADHLRMGMEAKYEVVPRGELVARRN
jgi:hephaestin